VAARRDQYFCLIAPKFSAAFYAAIILRNVRSFDMLDFATLRQFSTIVVKLKTAHLVDIF